MDEKLFEKLEELDISDTDLLLNENINLSVDIVTRKRIEQSIKKKTGCYNKSNIFKDKINNILRGIHMKKKIAVAVAAVMVLSLGGGGYAYARTPVAYVSLDINPSVELGVNAFDQVVSAEAYNEDGEKVLEGTDLINSNVDSAVSAVISNAISDGYIKEDGSSAIEITATTDKEELANKLEESLKETADKTLENNNVKAEVETENVALARRDEARKLGITPGKLNLIQKLQQLDPSINVEDYKSVSVKEIKKKTKELRKNSNDGNTIDKDNSDTNLNTDTNANTDTNSSISTDTDTNDDAIIETDHKDETLSSKSIESKDADVERKNNEWKEKDINGAVKKEENSNKDKEENIKNDKQENSKAASNKQEVKNGKSQGNSNSSKSENKENNNGKGKNN